MTSPLLYGGLFGWSFLAATVLPLSSEIPRAMLLRERGEFPLPVLVATAGNVLGSRTTYWLGRRAGRALAPGHPQAHERARAVRLLRRWGGPALLLSWDPLLGDTLVAVAGALAFSFGRFVLWTACGKALRYLAVAWVIVGR